MLFKNVLKSTILLLSVIVFAQANANQICRNFKKALNKKGLGSYNQELVCYESKYKKGVYLGIDGRTDKMKAVEYLLSYGKNSITEIFVKFGHLSKKAHDNIGKIENLKSLSFIECEYNEIPSQFRNLKNLEELIIDYGDISKIPNFISGLTNLKVLAITTNQLTRIPENLSKLKNLEKLLLYSNKISGKIPESLNRLPKLKEFSVFGNKNIKGKILVNKSLKECSYDKNAKLCKPKEVKCARKYHFKSCNLI